MAAMTGHTACRRGDRPTGGRGRRHRHRHRRQRRRADPGQDGADPPDEHLRRSRAGRQPVVARLRHRPDRHRLHRRRRRGRDQRLRIDLSALRIVGDGLAWAPAAFFEQDGTPVPACSRGTLGRIEAALADAGIEAVIGHEIEFLLVDPDGEQLPSALWAQYGLAGVLEHEAFVRDVIAAATTAGVGIEQFHPEYGANQFEISLSPLAAGGRRRSAGADPDHHRPGRPAPRAAHQPVAGAVCRQRRIRCTPALLADHTRRAAVFRRNRRRRHDAGGGERGGRGDCADCRRRKASCADRSCPACGCSPATGPGAYVCWGTENREAAVRFVKGGPGSPHGGNVEVKIVDPSANPYLASAAILGLALDGIQRKAALPPETTIDPAKLSDSERERKPASLRCRSSGRSNCRTGRFGAAAAHPGRSARSTWSSRSAGWSRSATATLDPEQLADKFRMAWSL